MQSKTLVATGMCALALCLVPSAGCNTYPKGSGSGASGGTDTGDTSTTPEATGQDTQGTGGDTSTSSSTSTSDAPDTTEDTGPEPYPEECYEPEALIVVDSAVTPSGPMTIDEAWLGWDICGGPYIVLVQYSSAETSAGEVTLTIERNRPMDGPYFGVHPLKLLWEERPVGTIDIVEPLEGELGEHLHGFIELHGSGWDLSLEIDLLDCGIGECFCPCE